MLITVGSRIQSLLSRVACQHPVLPSIILRSRRTECFFNGRMMDHGGQSPVINPVLMGRVMIVAGLSL